MSYRYFRWHDFMQISYSVLQVFPEEFAMQARC